MSEENLAHEDDDDFDLEAYIKWRQENPDAEEAGPGGEDDDAAEEGEEDNDDAYDDENDDKKD